MKIHDLTRLITPEMQMFPGSRAPILEKTATVGFDGYMESLFTMSSHTGTHIDAPAHMLGDGRKLNDYPISSFWGKGMIIDCSKLETEQIETDDLLVANKRLEDLNNIDFILLYTGWAKLWGKETYLEGYPSLTVEAAQFLADKNITGIATDTISIDSVDSETFPVHHVLFRKDILIVENLAGPEQIKTDPFYFCCMPLKITSSEASPVRAFAVEM